MTPKTKESRSDIVHKTIAAVKIRCKRVTYPDGKGTKEAFFIETKDLDAIEKELSKR